MADYMTADLQVLLTEHQPTPTHCSTETIGFVQAVINLGLNNDHDCMRQVQSNNGHLFSQGCPATLNGHLDQRQ